MRIGQGVKEMLTADQQAETAAARACNDGMRLAVEAGDNGTRDLLAKIVKDEERNVEWAERARAASLRDRGASAVLTYWPSEFSQLRGQHRRTRYAEGRVANELLFQVLFTIGAHGAHAF